MNCTSENRDISETGIQYYANLSGENELNEVCVIYDYTPVSTVTYTSK